MEADMPKLQFFLEIAKKMVFKNLDNASATIAGNWVNRECCMHEEGLWVWVHNSCLGALQLGSNI